MSSLTLCPQGRRTANTPLPVRRSSGLVPPDSSPAAIKGAHATPTPLTQRCLKTMFRRFADVRRLREGLPFLRGWAPAEADRKLSSTTSSPEPSLAPRGARYSGLEAHVLPPCWESVAARDTGAFCLGAAPCFQYHVRVSLRPQVPDGSRRQCAQTPPPSLRPRQHSGRAPESGAVS